MCFTTLLTSSPATAADIDSGLVTEGDSISLGFNVKGVGVNAAAVVDWLFAAAEGLDDSDSMLTTGNCASLSSATSNGGLVVSASLIEVLELFRDVEVFLFFFVLLVDLCGCVQTGEDSFLVLFDRVTSDPVPAKMALVSVEPSLVLESSVKRSYISLDLKNRR